jgi:hypothetical protein
MWLKFESFSALAYIHVEALSIERNTGKSYNVMTKNYGACRSTNKRVRKSPGNAQNEHPRDFDSICVGLLFMRRRREFSLEDM